MVVVGKANACLQPRGCWIEIILRGQFVPGGRATAYRKFWEMDHACCKRLPLHTHTIVFLLQVGTSTLESIGLQNFQGNR